jgi:hypothetical protein
MQDTDPSGFEIAFTSSFHFPPPSRESSSRIPASLGLASSRSGKHPALTS